MSALVLRLSAAPPFRLDLSALMPTLAAWEGIDALARLALPGGGETLALGDVFQLAGDDPTAAVIEGATDKLDGVGARMTAGSLRVEGSLGAYAGRGMSGGRLVIAGDAGPWLGAGLRGGTVQLRGHAGDHAAGMAPSDEIGMRGGVIWIDGDAGERIGDKMRRGLVLVGGQAGRFAGSRMMGGTIIARGGFDGQAGPLMRRGTLIGPQAAETLPTFVDCGRHDLTILRLLGVHLAAIGAKEFRPRPLARRLQGDMATIGRGEILLANIG